MKHTEGKWSVAEIDNKKNRYAIEDDGYPVAEVIGKSTANLISSAPEMLTALKLAKMRIDNPFTAGNLEHLSMILGGTIAKAEGK